MSGKKSVGILLTTGLLITTIMVGIPRQPHEGTQIVSKNSVVPVVKKEKTLNKIKPKARIRKIYWKVPLSHDLQDHITRLCIKYNVSEELVYGVMQTESSFNPRAVSNAGAYGLMQVNNINMPYLRRTLGITDLFNPYQNVNAGIFILSGLIHKYGDVDKVLIAYNVGESGMQTLASRGISITHYTRKVKHYMTNLKQIGVNVSGKLILESQRPRFHVSVCMD